MTFQDKAYVAKQYSDPSRLRARAALYDFMVPRVDVFSAAFDTLVLRGQEKILEVGCGEGNTLGRLRVERKHLGSLIGCDISERMIGEAKRNTDESLAVHPIHFLVSDAAALPFDAGCFDILLSFFMVYHMPNIAEALAEWKRVLRHDGRLVVATNSRYSRPRLAALKALVGERLRAEVPRSFSESFDLENGPMQLQRIFGNTRLHEFEADLRIPESGPCVEALKSVRDAFVPSPSEQTWEQAIAETRTIIGNEISSVGYFSDTVKTGFFLAC